MKQTKKTPKIYGMMALLLLAVHLTGCASGGGSLAPSNSYDINTRLEYHFANAPAPFTSNSQTILLMHMNEGVGPTVVDASSNSPSNDGQTVAAPTFVSGKFSNAITLNGTTQYVNVTHNSTQALTNKMTIEAWVYPNTIAAGTRTIISKWGAAANLGWNLQLFAATPRLLLSSTGSNTFTFTSTVPIVAGQWSHIAAVADGSFVYLYVNGVLALKSLYNAPINNSTAAIRIGADNSTVGGANFFNGGIDETYVKKDAALTLPMQASVIDSSVNNIYGELIGNIESTVSPINGNYLALSGTNQFVRATSTALNIQGPWAIESYVRTTSIGTPQNILVKGTLASNNVNYGIQISGTAPAGRIRVFFNDDFANLYEVYSVTQIATNTWYHVAGTWDGSTLKVYVNGVLEATVNSGSGVTPALNSIAVNIGRDGGGLNSFTGHLDKVRVSDIARTAFLNN